jgi:enoyl-CoA hydratase
LPDALRVERHSGGVVLLVLDLPDVRNAMTEQLTEQWAGAVTGLRGRPHGAVRGRHG